MIEPVLPLRTQADVESATTDLLPRWAGQVLEPDHPGGPGAAWVHRGAVGVFAPALNCRDRLVLAGDPTGVAEIIQDVLPELPDSTRPLVPAELAGGLRERLPLIERATFGWMEHRGPIRTPRPPTGYGWGWRGDDASLGRLLDVANPDAWVRPGAPGALRWYGASVGGRLVSVAAEAWSARGTGFIGGVATASGHRGLGLSTVVCGRLAEALLAARGAVSLMVNADNHPAIRAYTRLGFSYRAVTALAARSSFVAGNR